MSMRRLRVKAVANLSAKRKSTSPVAIPAVEAVKAEEQKIVRSDISPAENLDKIPNDYLIDDARSAELSAIPVPVKSAAVADSSTSDSATPATLVKEQAKSEAAGTMSSTTSTTDADQHILRSDMEEKVLQMDWRKLLNENPAISPSEVQQSGRKRMRLNPIFDESPNNFVASSHSPRTSDNAAAGSVDFIAPIPNRRKRHYSSLYSQSSSASPAAANSTICKRREFKARCSKDMPDKSTFKMSDYMFHNPTANQIQQSTSTTAEPELEPDVDDSNANEKEVNPVPQLKLGANGEVIVDKKSLKAETTAAKCARKVLAEASTIVEDGSGSYKRKIICSKKWQPEETEKFYRCLQTIGTDFSAMCSLFEDRTRRQLKLKFKREERVNAALIDRVLSYPKNFNIDDLKAEFANEERESEESKREWKAIKAREPVILKQRKRGYLSAGARALTFGDEVYANENVYKRKLSNRAIGKMRKKSSSSSSSSSSTNNNNNSHTTTDATQYDSDDNQSTITSQPNEVEEESQPFLTQSAMSMTTQTESEYGGITDEAALSDQLEFAELEMEHDLHEVLPTAPPENQELQYSNDTCDYAVDAPAECDAQYDAEAPRPAELPDINEEYVQGILRQLNSGLLILVTDEVENRPIRHALHIMDTATGRLSDRPLDLPDVVVQCVLSVLSET